jgi:hypothetical protein
MRARDDASHKGECFHALILCAQGFPAPEDHWNLLPLYFFFPCNNSIGIYSAIAA